MSTRINTQDAPVSIADALGHNPTIVALETRNGLVTVKCKGLPLDEWGRHREECANTIEVTEGQAIFSGGSLCCDDCCKRYNRNRRIEECKTEWKRWMSENAQSYAHFSTDHEDFNSEAWAELKPLPVSKNVILFGPTGTGKTFLMLQRMKSALWNGKAPMVLWADQLKRLTRDRYNSREADIYANAGVLGIEELFGEDSAREAYTSFVRNLIDVRMRLNKPTIITTQLSSKDVAGEFNKYDNESTADVERRQAILRRINEAYYPINTDRNRDYAVGSKF